jgi:hypothetical protein
VVVAPVRARLRARHRAARLAVEGVLEEHRLDVELVRLELVEDQLRVVRAVVGADARVVAADDEVRAAVVLAADRVPDRLARPRVAHRRRERGEDDAVGRVVAVEQDVVAVDPGLCGHVVRLRVADERVDEQPVDRLERDLRQVLVRAVDRVPGLEADHAAPAALGERRAGLGGVERELRELGLGPLEHRHLAGEVPVVLREQAGHARVRVVGRAEAALGLALLVVLVDLLDVEHGEQAPRLVGQGDAIAGRWGRHREADGQRPRQAARKAHLVDDALVVLAAHEALERRERTGGEHVEVGSLARGDRDHLVALDIVRPLAGAVDERAAVRLDQAVRRDRGHAVTCASTSPSSSSLATISPADSSASCSSVSITSAGFTGSSYGSSTPVKPLISPRSAFS